MMRWRCNEGRKSQARSREPEEGTGNEIRAMTARTFQDLEMWKRAHAWVLGIYKLSAGFPRQEVFGLTSQLRRAAVSVPANIAEGFVRRGRADKVRFYNIAQGSLEEARYYLLLARDLGYGDTSALSAATDQISRMLDAYARAVASNRPRLLPGIFWLLASGFGLLSYNTSIARG